MAKRGMSLEDKRKVMLDIIRDSQSCWLLKDLEKTGAKKGVVLQSIKDVVQSLVDDDMVNTDKVGSSHWFWAFPSEAGQKAAKKRAALEEELKSVKQRRLDAEERKQAATDQRPDSDERTATLAGLASLEVRHAHVTAELSKYQEGGAEQFEQLKTDIESAHEAANRWTDNIFQLEKWCNEKFQGESGRVKEG
eukprot:CAMPEP_0196588614 /NCGR_PEP_ID=MMETSP1081-20130531/61104_1 /TAXON_ID=36882 /ORGANISM="Pyramimonas amylifera, Strain CCMP720" /LENGTH=192 /DNA_ID=CAMNT_0041911153 /DNA_START=119 /DNA_END=694 /DNA_ORIENTATION=+